MGPDYARCNKIFKEISNLIFFCLKLGLSISAVSLELKFIFLDFVAGGSPLTRVGREKMWAELLFVLFQQLHSEIPLATGCSMIVKHAAF